MFKKFIVISCILYSILSLVYTASVSLFYEQPTKLSLELKSGIKTLDKSELKEIKELIKQSKEVSNEEETNYLGTFLITYYCDCPLCQEEFVGMTATGEYPTPGRTIAVDPRVIPYYTHVIIDGHEYVAEDCGGYIVGNHIDILVGDHDLCNELGISYKDVYIK